MFMDGSPRKALLFGMSICNELGWKVNQCPGACTVNAPDYAPVLTGARSEPWLYNSRGEVIALKKRRFDEIQEAFVEGGCL